MAVNSKHLEPNIRNDGEQTLFLGSREERSGAFERENEEIWMSESVKGCMESDG